MSDPNASHLEQAKQHLREAQKVAGGRADNGALHLVWAVDELLRHIEEL